MPIVTASDLPDLAKEKDVAEYTGMSSPTLRRRRAEGLPPQYIKIGSAVRYPKAQLIAWVESLVSEAG